MTKQKKLWIIIISAILAVALITTALILIITNNNREKTATSIMSCSANTKVHFVLNGNDKVIETIALNSKGEEIAEYGQFKGLTAHEAAGLFVKLSTQAGYIKYDTTGTTVDITLTGLKNDYIQIKDKVVAQVNKYFNENGIIAGAVVKIDEDIKNTIKEIKETAKLDNKDDKALMTYYTDLLSMIINSETNYKLKADLIKDFFKAYDEQEAKKAEAEEKCNKEINELKAKLATLTDETEIQKAEDRIYVLEEALNNAIITYNKALDNYKTAWSTSSDYLQGVVKAFTTKVDSQADAFKAHVDSFNSDRTYIEQKIAEFRATLEA